MRTRTSALGEPDTDGPGRPRPPAGSRAGGFGRPSPCAGARRNRQATLRWRAASLTTVARPRGGAAGEGVR
jgi:hypothetical protein